jgi:hypothetical protein
VGQTENEDSLHEQWETLAVRLGKDLMTMDDLKATQLQDGESSHEKSSDVVCRRKSKFFEAKVPMFNMKKSSTAPMTEVFGVDYKERFIAHEQTPPTVPGITQAMQPKDMRPPEQASDEWGD